MREFKGRVDGWFYIVMAASCLLMLWVCGMLLREGELAAALIDALVLAMVLLLWLPICLRNYLLLDDGVGEVLASLLSALERGEIRFGTPVASVL